MTQVSTKSVQTMTSLEIVDMINKERAALFANGQAKKYVELRHDSFMKKVADTLGEAAPKFIGTAFYEVNNAKREREIYIFPKREATLMAMSYSPAISAAVYDRMTELEEQVLAAIATPALPNFGNPAEAARAWALEYERSVALAVEVEQKKELLVIAAPKVEFVDQFVEADGALGIQAASRLLRMNMRELSHWLVDEKLCFRRSPANDLIPYSTKIDQGLFVVKTGLRPGSEGPHAFEQMKITTKGLAYISENAPKYVRK
ncbi:putative antirepressor protein [Pseudomonas phage vB_PsyM_KIL3b]|uniref:Putative antirepressor protein n=6 Tax=Flaumdravirus TaxID=2560133 RepID=A0A142IEV8_9CAUD|nr:putative antirepressor protein [Pseudomonas phage vB_PsyM_KIL1]YP_009616716.1 putative antirepressor protein [Pseudomonas phage vB_PsyM_KIL4]AMR57442.1 putative antirepressor protein [Pseudomonas phage vB_PsyM_KIL2]AMR57602.1 putative antirepressor protein [Pseudomonas phage vB_PsyM_KIL3]AMR57930.1 putative antirepressor protein [Pseudomonas phage vB_PsyM_KIL5]AMR58100.1 putative antirepressor protein [Pseudomonas phage vB_PsyM_KIL3b]AMR57282.1 putative antirepressor protein [Pseudomonas p